MRMFPAIAGGAAFPGGIVDGVPQPGKLETINWWTGGFMAVKK